MVRQNKTGSWQIMFLLPFMLAHEENKRFANAAEPHKNDILI
jgi:hypothetical protein